MKNALGHITSSSHPPQGSLLSEEESGNVTGSSLAHSQLRLGFAYREPSSLGAMWKPSSPRQAGGGSAGDTDMTEHHQRAHASLSSAIPEPAGLHLCHVPFVATALEGKSRRRKNVSKKVGTKNTLKGDLPTRAELPAEGRPVYRLNPLIFMHFSNISTSFLAAAYFYY